MKKIFAAAAALSLLAGTAAVQARDHRPSHERIAPEDRAAMQDARIAALKAGLKLTPEQEKLWPALETSLRDYAKMKSDQAAAFKKERDERREAREKVREEGKDAKASHRKDRDMIASMKRRADAMATNGAALQKVVAAAEPLYNTLDDGQKRRLNALMRLDDHGSMKKWRGKHEHRHGRGKDD